MTKKFKSYGKVVKYDLNYYCNKCKRKHRITSKIGKEHKIQNKQKIIYKYYAFNRPLYIGTYPNNNIIKINNYPVKENINVDFLNCKVFGYIIYNKKLSFKQIYNFELIPSNKKEYGMYMIWSKENKNIKNMKKIISMYKKMDINEIKKWKDRDPYAYYILLILNKN